MQLFKCVFVVLFAWQCTIANGVELGEDPLGLGDVLPGLPGLPDIGELLPDIGELLPGLADLLLGSIFGKFVNPMEEITDYCTEFSGIRAEDLVNAPPINLVVQEVASIVEGRILVGHSIHNDMEVLELDHPIAALRDTANFFQHHNGRKRPPSLKNLIKDFFKTTIQDGEHSSIQDAQAALRLYLLFRKEWENEASERRRKANLEETMTDITCMHVQPRPPDLFTESESIFIRPNDNFSSKHALVKTFFLLQVLILNHRITHG